MQSSPWPLRHSIGIDKQLTDLCQNIKIHTTREINDCTENIESALLYHKNQLERGLINISACITIMEKKIDEHKCSCDTNNNMNKLEEILNKIQAQQVVDKNEIQQQIMELKNTNKIIPQSTPLSEVPRFHPE